MSRKLRIVECSIVPLFTRFGEETELYLTSLTPEQLAIKLEQEYSDEKYEYEVSCHEEVLLSPSKIREIKEVLDGKKDSVELYKIVPEEY